VTLWRFEISHKLARGQLRALRRKLGDEDVRIGRSAAPQVSAR
jgi:hypothetical protein